MKKILVLAIALTVALSASVFASPLSDYSQGKAAIDLHIVSSELNTSDNVFDGSTDWDKQTNFQGAITGGLGNNFALQYKYQKIDSATSDTILGISQAKGTVQDFNVLYKANKNWVAFVGAHKLSSSELDTEELGNAGVKSTTKYQVGVTGTSKLGDQFDGWVTVAAGNNNTSCELGIGRKLSPDADLNVFYRYMKFTDLELSKIAGYKFDAKSNGFGVGVTVKL